MDSLVSGNFIYADDPALPPVLVIFAMWGTQARSTTNERILDHAANECRRLGARVATGDQFASYQNQGALARRGIRFEPRNWSATSKHAGVVLLRTLMRDRRLLLVPDASPEDKKTLERQLVQYTERAGSGGLFSYSSRGGLSDRASVVLTAAIASLFDRGAAVTLRHRRPDAEAARGQDGARFGRLRSWSRLNNGRTNMGRKTIEESRR